MPFRTAGPLDGLLINGLQDSEGEDDPASAQNHLFLVKLNCGIGARLI